MGKNLKENIFYEQTEKSSFTVHQLPYVLNGASRCLLTNNCNLISANVTADHIQAVHLIEATDREECLK